MRFMKWPIRSASGPATTIRRLRRLIIVALLAPTIPWLHGGTGDALADTAGHGEAQTILVLGDSLAEGYWQGLHRKLLGDPRFRILRESRHSTGLSRPDVFDWPAALPDLLTGQGIDVVVVVIGGNDLQALYLDGRRQFTFGSESWDEHYAQRVETMMRALQDAGVTVFWMGLPSVRDDDLAAQVRHLNDLYAHSAAQVGASFVPLWDLTTDEDGQYATYLPDADGRSRQMRGDDGVHFTHEGYAMVADHLLAAVDRELGLFLTVQAGDD